MAGKTKKEAATHAAAMARLVERFRQSGLSQTAFCKRENIKPHVLQYWHGKAKRQVSSEAEPGLTFVEWTDAGSNSNSPSAGRVELTLTSGATVRLFGAVDVDMLRPLIQMLEGHH